MAVMQDPPAAGAGKPVRAAVAQSTNDETHHQIWTTRAQFVQIHIAISLA
jgi:hypothetical protein